MSDSVHVFVAGTKFAFSQERELFIGRANEAHIKLGSPYVSRRHGRLFATEQGWTYEDLGSRHGTRFRGNRITNLLLVGPVTLLLGEPGRGVEVHIVPQHPSRIFICYRRGDSGGHAGRLRDRLAEAFGETQVFRDIDSIEMGEDFVDRITRTIAACRVVLVLIGPRWLTALNAEGGRRLDDPDDYVRLEVSAALRAPQSVTVIPVLVQGADMPRTADLPDDLLPLSRRSALLAPDDQWSREMGTLVERIETIMRTPVDTP
jgi:hypothetical protein